MLAEKILRLTDACPGFSAKWPKSAAGCLRINFRHCANLLVRKYAIS